MHLKYLRWKAEVPSITSDIIPSKCWPQIQIVLIFHPLKTSKLKKKASSSQFYKHSTVKNSTYKMEESRVPELVDFKT